MLPLHYTSLGNSVIVLLVAECMARPDPFRSRLTPSKQQTNLSLDDEDLARLKNLADVGGWSKTETVRQALIALEEGLKQYRARQAGLAAEHSELYGRVVEELGYEVVLMEPSFGHTSNGFPEVTIDGLHYFATYDYGPLEAWRWSSEDGAPRFELFTVRNGGLEPGLRVGADRAETESPSE